jgi:ribonuclease Z
MQSSTVLFLGTASSIPTKHRNHSAILWTYKNENILIDCGEGTQRQFRKADLSPTKISRILLTHWHGDHFLGLPALIQTLGMSEYSKVLQIYGPKGTKKHLSFLLKTLGIVKIKIEVHEVNSGKILETPDFKILCSPMKHGTPTLAYSILLKEKIRLDKTKLKKLKLPNSPILKKLQEGKDISHKGKKINSSSVTYLEPGKKITIILDTLQNPNTTKIAKSSDLLITEASFLSQDSKLAKDHNHLTVSQSAQIAKSSKSKLLVLTHISQRYPNPTVLLQEAQKTFKNTKLVRDLDKIEI